MGKRRLERALELFRERHPDAAPPAVRWLPFQLNPDLPARGIPRVEYVRRKFGAGGGNYARVAGVGKTVGIDFEFDRITVQPNTVPAHRLMWHAEAAGAQDAVAEALFRGYFVEGRDMTDPATLAALAAEAGLDEPATAAYLQGDGDREEVLSADQEARQAGIGGVPFFIFNRRVGVSGAQEPEVLLDAMEQALAAPAG